MKLYITVPSPYARKCRVVAREKGLADRIEEIAVDPYANAPELLASNPLVQVPTLIAEDGLPLNDSPVICEYLDALGTGPRLLPESGEERLRVRRLETLARKAQDRESLETTQDGTAVGRSEGEANRKLPRGR